MAKKSLIILAAIVPMVFAPPLRQVGADSSEPHGGPRIVTYNVCGGSCPKQLSQREWNDSITGLLRYADADVILFQELCHGQYESLQQVLGDRYDSRWGGTMTGNTGCGKQWGEGEDEGFGLAVFVRGAGSIRSSERRSLPDEEDHEPRILLCVDTALRGRSVRVCDTHLDYHPATERLQAAYVQRVVTPWAARTPLIVGGDMNATPMLQQMAGFYRRGDGAFLEADETDRDYFLGEDTEQGRKVDYIFFSRRHFESPIGRVAERDRLLSDHQPLLGTASWRAGSERRTS
ncbi:MAG TPA: endonuclease/exonuclease/phosphatase family protein [Thermopolyspora sp.]|jgi:Metal-dependent hydrolase